MHNARIYLEDIDYILPNGASLIGGFTVEINNRVTGIVGRNGIGKSIIAQIMAGKILPTNGSVYASGVVSFVPQSWSGNPSDLVEEVLGLEKTIEAISKIEAGTACDNDYGTAENGWDWREKLKLLIVALGIDFEVDIKRSIGGYSGGEQVLIMLLSALFKYPDILVLDEPSNHLDRKYRKKLIEWIKSTKKMIIVVSHDPELLNEVQSIIELSDKGINIHSGTYDTYQAKRRSRIIKQENDLTKAKAALGREKRQAQSAYEKQQQRESRGKSKAKIKGLSPIEIGGAKENSSANQSRHAKIAENRINNSLSIAQDANDKLEWINPIEFELPDSSVSNTQKILTLDELKWGYNVSLPHKLTFNLIGPTRVHLSGSNGVGKSALLKTILGELVPKGGRFKLFSKVAYLDQKCSVLDDRLSVLENFMEINPGWSEKEYRDRLAWLRFRGDRVLVSVSKLSGGEKLKVALACALLGPSVPQLLLLDEPTNHLDFDSREALIGALDKYNGAIIVVSHDNDFVQKMSCNTVIELEELL